MNIDKKIPIKYAVLIIGMCVVIGFAVSFFTVSKCRYSPKNRNPNLLTFNPEPARTVTACYFVWQCQFIKGEEGQEVCYDQFQ